MSKKRKILAQQQNNQRAWLRIDKWTNLVILLAIALIPLLIHAKSGLFISPSLTSGVATSMKVELYTSYKFYFLLLAASVLIGLLLLKTINHHYDIQKTPINILLLILCALLLISLFAAQYKSVALYGSFDRREGTLTFVCYLALFLAAINATLAPHFSRWLKTALGVVIAINLAFGLAAFYGHNPLDIGWLKGWLVPTGLKGFQPEGIIRSTLSNPNYVSGFSSALLAFFLVYAFNEPGWKNKLINLVLALACFIILLTSLSSSGFVSLLIAAPLILYLALHKQKPGQILIYTGLTAAVVAALFYYASTYQPLVYHEALTKPREAVSEVSQWFSPDQEKQSDRLNPLDLPSPGIAPLSGRFYLWDKTLNLIKEQPVTGYGRDTIVYYFPHNDPDMLANMGTYSGVVDKPHCYYLEVAFGSGLISLLVLLAIFAFILTYAWKAAHSQNKHSVLASAILAFTAVYLLQWLVNDSIIAGSVVFWLLNGVAVGIFLDAKRTSA